MTKSNLRAVFLIMSLAMLAAPCVFAEAFVCNSPVLNPGFELPFQDFGPRPWCWSHPMIKKPGQVAVDFNEKHSGKASLRISSAGEPTEGTLVSAIDRSLNLAPGTNCRLKVWMKALIESGSACASLQFFGPNIKDGTTGKGITFGETTEWREFSSGPLTVPESERGRIQLKVGPDFKGSIWFDDISLEADRDISPKSAGLKADDMVLHFDFDEGQGDTVRDRSQWHNDGRITNPRWGKGIRGTALQLGGDTGVTVADALSLRQWNAFTLEAWVCPFDDPPGKHQRLITKGDFTGGLTWGLYYKRMEQFGRGSYTSIFCSVNEWNHLVISNDGKISRVYKNGDLYGIFSSPAGFEPSQEPLLIGGKANAAMNGLIDEVRIYKRALSGQEVSERYSQLSGIQRREEQAYALKEALPCPSVAAAVIRPDRVTDALGRPGYRENLSVYVKNTHDAPMEITKVSINGMELNEQLDEFYEKKHRGILWHTVNPVVIPPGAYGEITVRYMETGMAPENFDFCFADAENIEERGRVTAAKEPLGFNAVGFNESLSEGYLYISCAEATTIREVSFNGKPVRYWAYNSRIEPAAVTPVIMYFESQRAEGETGIIQVLTDRGSATLLTLVQKPVFPLGMYCVSPQGYNLKAEETWQKTFGEWWPAYKDKCVGGSGKPWFIPEWFRDCRNHFFTVLTAPYFFENRHLQPKAAAFKAVEENGLQLVTSGGNDDILPYKNTLYFFVSDEVAGVRLAKLRAETVRKLRKARPDVPCWVTFNVMGGNPSDFTYVDCASCPCYPVRGYTPVRGAVLNIGRMVRELREEIAPRPVGFVPQAFRWVTMDDKERANIRFPFPEEERLMVYQAVASGATDIAYFHYMVDAWDAAEGVGAAAQIGIPEGVALWEEMGRINLELRVLGPLLRAGCVLNHETRGDLEISQILAGKDTVITVIVNTDYSVENRKFAGTEKKVNLAVNLPAYLKPASVFEFAHDGARDIKFAETKSGISANTNVGTVRVIVTSADGNLKNRLNSNLKDLLKIRERN